MKVIILPGNGCTNVLRSNWYGWLHRELNKAGINCVAETMPDPHQARRSIWIPFIRNNLKADEDTILVGHSSGAQAALRYAEDHKVRGVILVSATYTDLGDAGERASGYYPLKDETENLYNFSAMRENCKLWYQFHSDDDCFIPVEEAERIKEGLGLSEDQYKMYTGRSHFFEPPFPELVDRIKDFVESG